MASPFTPKTLAFLRALKRNNDRDWFRARRADYERHVRGPMVELLERLAVDFRAFAPELVAEAQRAQLDINPLSGPQLQQIVDDFYKMPENVKARLKTALTVTT